MPTSSTEPSTPFSQQRENYFSIFKRGIYGVYHSISEAHLQPLSRRVRFPLQQPLELGVEDEERAEKIIKGTEGKRLTCSAAD